MNELHLQPPDPPEGLPRGKTLTWEWDDFNLVGHPLGRHDNPKEPRLCATFAFDADDEDWSFDGLGAMYFCDANGEDVNIEIGERDPILDPYLKRLDEAVREHIATADLEDWE